MPPRGPAASGRQPIDPKAGSAAAVAQGHVADRVLSRGQWVVISKPCAERAAARAPVNSASSLERIEGAQRPRQSANGSPSGPGALRSRGRRQILRHGQPAEHGGRSRARQDGTHCQPLPVRPKLRHIAGASLPGDRGARGRPVADHRGNRAARRSIGLAATLGAEAQGLRGRDHRDRIQAGADQVEQSGARSGAAAPALSCSRSATESDCDRARARTTRASASAVISCASC